MRVFGKEAGPAAALWAVAALLAAAAPAAADEGGVTVAEGATAPKEGTKDAKAPATAKPADAKAPAKTAETKPVEKAPAGPPKPGMWASMDDFMKRTGQKFEEKRFLGMRLRVSLAETVAWTDNAFYQNDAGTLVVDHTSGINSRPNDTDGPGGPIVEDPDADGDGDNRAHPHLGAERGKVTELVNNAKLTAGLELPINLTLVPVMFQREEDRKSSVQLVKGYFESKEYLLHDDSPDAWNWGASVDVPVLLDNFLGRLLRITGERSHLYFRFEGDINHVTDPLDAQIFGLNSSGTFFRSGNRNDFERQEWWVKGTVGWKGPVLDALVSAKHLDFSIRDDESLDSADHTEDTGYGEVGYTTGQHRLFGFFEYTDYEFPDRSGPNGAIPSLRDFSRTKTGLGLSGPVLTQKITGTARLYYMNTNIFNPGDFSDMPLWQDPETGVGRNGPGPAGNPKRVLLKDRNWIAGSADFTYRPFKVTRINAQYDRSVEWSVVAQEKLVDKASISFSHNLNQKLTALLKYSATWEDVTHREQRFYQELGAGFQYALMSHTTLDVQYTLRYMKSSNEPVTASADVNGEGYYIRPNGDFLANIVSVGITVSF